MTSKITARLATIARWFRMTAMAGEKATPEQLLSWAEGLEQIAIDLGNEGVTYATATPDPIIAFQRDRINIIEAELILDSLHKLVGRLAYHAQQAATVSELVEIDNVSSAIIDGAAVLGRGIAWPQQTQTETGA